jgi:endonuclease/exonuclease/phosphatase (EEP) superfamily protein YafD
MTHNLYFGNTQTDQIIGVIEDNAPDVVTLNELNDFVAQELVTKISGEYPYYRIEAWNGIFSRFPIQEYTTFVMSEVEGGTRLAQECVLEIDGRQVTLINAHPYTVPIALKKFNLFGVPLGLPLALNNTYRDADLEGVLSQIEQVDGSLIVMGDFNLTDQQDDYKELTRNLTDSHRESGWGLGLTFTRYPRIGTPMWRIDYVFHSPDMVALHTTVGDYGNSDHKPVIAELGFLDVKQE